MFEITSAQARAYLTHLHFHDARNKRDNPVDALIAHVERLSCVQYDPLNVVGRNPDLVMQSRIEHYKPEMLYRALYEKRALVEGYDKNLALFSIEDYPRLARIRAGTVRWAREQAQIMDVLPQVLAEVERRGALCSDDIALREKVRWPWGSTKLGRAALETLWMDGRLMLSHRNGARRYFDLAARCYPKRILTAPDPNADDTDYYKWQFHRRVRSVGMLTGGASDAFLGVAGMKAAQRTAARDALEAEGTLLPVHITDIKRRMYISRLDADVLKKAMNEKAPRIARVIAPLDNLIWDRKLIQALFGFTYRWEVYVPKEQRKYGYYVLPILCGDRFVARIEPAHFRGGMLVIKTLWWENAVDPAAYEAVLDACFDRFAAYLSADGWTIEETKMSG